MRGGAAQCRGELAAAGNQRARRLARLQVLHLRLGRQHPAHADAHPPGEAAAGRELGAAGRLHLGLQRHPWRQRQLPAPGGRLGARLRRVPGHARSARQPFPGRHRAGDPPRARRRGAAGTELHYLPADTDRGASLRHRDGARPCQRDPAARRAVLHRPRPLAAGTDRDDGQPARLPRRFRPGDAVRQRRRGAGTLPVAQPLPCRDLARLPQPPARRRARPGHTGNAQAGGHPRLHRAHCPGDAAHTRRRALGPGQRRLLGRRSGQCGGGRELPPR